MEYFITESPHYKVWANPKVIYKTDNKADMLKKARQLVFQHIMVDCWCGKWESIGAVIKVGEKTAYLFNIDRNTHEDVFKRITPNGTVDSKVTQKGKIQADKILRHWM